MSSGRLQEVKNNGKSLTVRPKKWSRSLTGGGRLLEVSTVTGFDWKILVFWIGGRLWKVVAYERWSYVEVRGSNVHIYVSL